MTDGNPVEVTLQSSIVYYIIFIITQCTMKYKCMLLRSLTVSQSTPIHSTLRPNCTCYINYILDMCNYDVFKHEQNIYPATNFSLIFIGRISRHLNLRPRTQRHGSIMIRIVKTAPTFIT
jgi:hypothetical protein